MSDEFNAYHRWLGIPPKDQPPNHYRLLGVELFESDPEVIRDAAARQMAHVRTYQLGQHSDLSQTILNELAVAKACLSDPVRKAEYDADLRASLVPKAAPVRPVTTPPPIAPRLDGTTVESRVYPSVSAQTERPGVQPARRTVELRWNAMILGVVAGALLVLVLGWMAFGPSSTKKVANSPETADRSAPAKTSKQATPVPPTKPKPVPVGLESLAPKSDAARSTEPVPSVPVAKPATEPTVPEPRRAEKPTPTPDKPAVPKASPPADELASIRALPKVITNSIGMKLVLIPAGEFMMGSPDTEQDRSSDEGPVHRVRITKAFYLGHYEITQEEYQQVMGKNPSYFSARGSGKVSGQDTSRFPVENVSWDAAVDFCKRLSEKEGKRYRLPTEAEWEYACRAGTTTPFSFGRVLNGREANCNGNNPYGTSDKGTYLGRTTTVGLYRPNAFGLYDMHGNMWEWCSDWRGSYTSGDQVDPTGPDDGSLRVGRGGSWYDGARDCRSAFRLRYSPVRRIIRLGFRVSRVAE